MYHFVYDINKVIRKQTNKNVLDNFSKISNNFLKISEESPKVVWKSYKFFWMFQYLDKLQTN